MKIKAIIFDLGKVVFDLSFENVFQSWANASGQEYHYIKNKFVFDEVFEKFERSELSETDFRAAICNNLRISLSEEDFDKGWCSLYLDIYPGIVELLLHLKNNYRVVALTNTNIIHDEVWRFKYSEILEHFEKIFSSHEMQTRKPEKKSYQIVLDYLQNRPEETVFLDDNINNINGAQKLGITSILVESQEQMKMELMSLGLI